MIPRSDVRQCDLARLLQLRVDLRRDVVQVIVRNQLPLFQRYAGRPRVGTRRIFLAHLLHAVLQTARETTGLRARHKDRAREGGWVEGRGGEGRPR